MDLETTDRLSTLARSALTFINVFDVGMNKSVFEILPPLGVHCKRIVQINALNLAVYGTTETLCECYISTCTCTYICTVLCMLIDETNMTMLFFIIL